MAYLGNDLQVAFPVYRNIDDISGSFNSSTTSFPLRVSGVAPVPAPLYSQQCLISVGGVVQRPDDSGSEGFRLSGGNIIFASAPTTGADFFGVILAGADYVNAGGNFPSGTAGVPSITFNDDLDTGIYNSGTNQLSITTGGSERLRIDSAGQIESVSLGTAATPAFSFTSDPNTGIYSPGADQVAISTGGSGQVFVSSNGNLGVGTLNATNAAGKIHSRADGNEAKSLLVLQNRDAGASAGGAINFVNGGVDLSDNRYSYIRSIITGAGQNGNHLVFGTNANGEAPSERLRITSAGLVGVGTSSPGALLHVAGNTDNNVQSILAAGNDSNFRLVSINKSAANISGSELARFGIRYATGTDDSSGVQFFRGNTAAEGHLGLYTGGTTRLYVQGTTGNVGIGTTSPTHSLDVNSAIRLRGAGASTEEGDLHLYYVSDSNRATVTSSTNRAIVFENGIGAVSERARIDSSGRLLVGTSSARGSMGARLQLEAAGAGAAEQLSITYNGDNSVGAYLELGKTRGTTVGSNTAVINGDELGAINFMGANGTDLRANIGARISAVVDAEPFTSGDTTDLPSRLVFSTTADGASSPTERMRIINNGGIYIGKTDGTMSIKGVAFEPYATTRITTDSTGVDEVPLYLNRQSTDGALLKFFQANTEEGNISVSGTTVSYNGAHLSRWSQLPFGQERTEILRGSVLSNIDEMCEWGDEDNEQLNRMKMSDVEGDKNVSGVFQAWDDDDDTYTNDFYCAMTGDFIIRIGAGVTVERGDLLMSAGDGTAKPQDDDIIRSKTIAKVTSTNVSCTYDDGSYCVPCVLMAC